MGPVPTASTPMETGWPPAALFTHETGNPGPGLEHGSPDWLNGSVTKLLMLPPAPTAPPAIRIDTGTKHPSVVSGTWKAIWSSPAQQPERPAAITLAGWFPTRTSTPTNNGVGATVASSPW